MSDALLALQHEKLFETTEGRPWVIKFKQDEFPAFTDIEEPDLVMITRISEEELRGFLQTRVLPMRITESLAYLVGILSSERLDGVIEINWRAFSPDKTKIHDWVRGQLQFKNEVKLVWQN